MSIFIYIFVIDKNDKKMDFKRILAGMVLIALIASIDQGWSIWSTLALGVAWAFLITRVMKELVN